MGLSNTLEVCQQKTKLTICWIWRKHWSCNSWLKEGDKITRFFHAKASNRKQCNRIVGVMDESKIWQDDEDKISEVITA